MSLAPRPASPPAIVAALALAALVAGALPDTGWNDALALFATTAALFAAHERRCRDMLVAAAIGSALSPAGLLLAPLFLGLAFNLRGTRHLPVAALVATLVALQTSWSLPLVPLPNLAILPNAWPVSLALVVAGGPGVAAWLAARASAAPRAMLFAEARLGTLLMAACLPLPPGALAFVAMIAALPLPAPALPRAANDNSLGRRVIRLAA